MVGENMTGEDVNQEGGDLLGLDGGNNGVDDQYEPGGMVDEHDD